MPFKKERYPADWKEISRRIRAREGNACKFCRAPNGQYISRDSSGCYMTAEGRVFRDDGSMAGWARGSEWEGARAIKVVLTVAHLNHVESDNSDSNLAALCQRCHLRHDAKDNRRRAAATRRARLAARDLF